MKRLLLAIPICLLLVLAGCGSLSTPTATPDGTQPYPTDQQNPNGENLPTPIADVDGPNFTLDRPLSVGATTVTGQGPFNLSIDIIDVTTMGEVLGSGKVSADGKFSVQLAQPLQAQHIVGIALPADARIADDAIKVLESKVGERARVYPQVTFVFDSEVVR